MKLAAIVEDGLRSEEFYCDYVPAVLRETGADGVMAIISGPITQSGFLPPEDSDTRAQKLRRAGCGLVVQVSVGGSLLKHDTYYYVLALKLRALDCGSFTELSGRLGAAEHEARQLLLRTALNYRYITHSNSALYSYVPSIRILSGEDTWVDFLKTNASVPVADSEEEMTEPELSAKKLYSAVYA